MNNDHKYSINFSTADVHFSSSSDHGIDNENNDYVVEGSLRRRMHPKQSIDYSIKLSSSIFEEDNYDGDAVTAHIIEPLITTADYIEIAAAAVLREPSSPHTDPVYNNKFSIDFSSTDYANNNNKADSNKKSSLQQQHSYDFSTDFDTSSSTDATRRLDFSIALSSSASLSYGYYYYYYYYSKPW